MDARLGRLLRWAFRLAALLCFPLLVTISIYDIVGRQFMNTGSTALQELQWHLFFASVMLALGWVYLRDGHVRIDILRARWPVPRQAGVEIAGILLALLPLALLLIVSGGAQAWTAFESDEHSQAAMGLGQRWIAKSLIPLGGALLLAAGLVALGRSVARLRRRPGTDG
ncbi:TRAP transporter small permease subunit [Thalassobaculum sp.]|uniref:TRAP transporter small permease subunit n=1 Tax=Thalassobaculum sp. TaxID=2022740 RepID=UPI0032EBBAC5